jgi:AcrR family transcriptional regulator
MAVPDETFGATQRGPDPRAVRSRASALAAARDILLEQGFAAVTHVAVAARSGVGRSTLYRHWPDVSDLVRDALRHHIAVAHTEPTGRLRTDLIRELEAGRAMLHEPTTERAMRIVIERASVDPAFTEIKTALHDAGSQVLRRIVEDAKARGELPSDLDTDLALDQLFGPLFFRRLLANCTFDDDFVHRVVDGFLRAYSTDEETRS